MTRITSPPVEAQQRPAEPYPPAHYAHSIPPVTITAPEDPAGPSGRHPFQDIYKFIFKPLNFNTMSLALETNHLRLMPRYYVSVSMDCMMPAASITSVYRHDTDGSTLVAEFGMGISADRATLTMREESGPMDNTFTDSRRVGWDWKRRKPQPGGAVSIVNLHWEESSAEKMVDCYLTNEVDRRSLGTAVAYMIIPTAHQSIGGLNSRRQIMLEVTAMGLDILDDIVVSCVLVQRRRLSPNVKDRSKTPIFN